MEVIRNFYQPWLEKWGSHRFQAILLICFLLWTPLLIAETLQVQNSCDPMIHWSKELIPKCQPIITDIDDNPPPKPSENPIQQSLKQIVESSKEHPDLSGASIGIAFATGAAIANAPLVVTVGIGIALWLAIRTALSP
ncbi:hypothetical protein QUA46_28255 [Microcoleus sp. MON2_D6]|uniref:hypothetical protein n=1 Tax=unclassified Microcoleus TaxID=2642155 RepID=UPI002FD4C243